MSQEGSSGMVFTTAAFKIYVHRMKYDSAYFLRFLNEYRLAISAMFEDVLRVFTTPRRYITHFATRLLAFRS